METYIGALTEDFDSKVQLITEQYESIIKKLDSHDDRFLGIEKKVDLEDFNALERRMILLEAKMRKV